MTEQEKLAEWLHNTYEEVSIEKGWNTQKKCKVEFKDLPKENKETMIEVCKRLLIKQAIQNSCTVVNK